MLLVYNEQKVKLINLCRIEMAVQYAKLIKYRRN